LILLFIDDNRVWKFIMFMMEIMVVIMKIICYDGDNKICSVSYGNNSISYNHSF
jgi:hypothetical protein